MKLLIRRANERGHANHGWLDTYHTFSFADYFDEAWMGFGMLRVINEDRIAGGGAFGMHGHRDMEILTYVLSGALRHTDSMGNSEVVQAGEFQRMTAGTGVMHSEENASKTEECHLYQIWILPNQQHLKPSYEQKSFAPLPTPRRTSGGPALKVDRTLIASTDARDGSLLIHQDAEVWLYRLGEGESVVTPTQAGTQKAFWLQVVSGAIQLSPLSSRAKQSEAEGSILHTSDAASFDENMEIKANSKSEFLVFVV